MVNSTAKHPPKDRILVALDNSHSSQAAARMAIPIAQSQDLMIHGLFIVDSQLVDHPDSDYQSELDHFQGTLSRPNLIIRLEEMGNQALTKLEAECRGAGVVVITEMVFGNVPETIQQKADRCVLLAVGRRGNGQREETHFLGQHFRAICHTVRKPILVGGEEKAVLRRILVAAPDEDLIQRADSYRSLLKSSMTAAFIPVVGRSSEEVAAEAVQQQVDLVLLAGYLPMNPLRWLVGSFTEQVIRKVSAPVLIVYDPIRL